MNVFTALHRLAIARQLPDENMHFPSCLFAFVRGGLMAEVSVISAALGFLARLHDDGYLNLFTQEEQRHLHDLLADLWLHPDEFIRGEMEILQLPGRPEK